MKDHQVTEHQPPWDGMHIGTLLDLDRLEDNVFRSRFSEDNRNGRVFGGQLLGQALRAAQKTVAAGRAPSALQVLFAQGALTHLPIEYYVFPLQDGKRFTSRRVEARQGKRTLIDAHVSFQVPSDGLDHALPPYHPVPLPEELIAMSEMSTRGGSAFADVDWAWFEKPCLELRVANPESHLLVASATPQTSYWVRLRTALGDDPTVHASALAYLSDYWVNTAAISHHVPIREVIPRYYVASLNHSLWMHRECRADDWLLFSTESPSTQSGRALTHARIYTRSGTLVASATQECLLADRTTMGGQ